MLHEFDLEAMSNTPTTATATTTPTTITTTTMRARRRRSHHFHHHHHHHPFSHNFFYYQLVFLCVQFLLALGRAECQLPPQWFGRWFHLGFSEPLQISAPEIQHKGLCVQQNVDKNMFLMRDSGNSFSSCYRCMMIYEKHFNVLQYKESYCEENIQSMEALCNTIPGDAPLFTMFRKDAQLVKCPFRGPHSFSYSKGDGSQVCEYPSSYMDTCSGNRRIQLQYQACLDVEGSEIAQEELSCLATWKEGSSHYLVASMNHSHIYTDNERYRCFVYQRQRPHHQQSHHHHHQIHEDDGTGPNDSPEVIYKMAQSNQASCLGLWSVDEGYKTFTFKKLQNEGDQCVFPSWLSTHHEWVSVDESTSIHLNKKEHSLKMTNHTSGVMSHVTCHKVDTPAKGVARVVAHVKAECESGYVCMEFHMRDKHVVQVRHGGQSRHPSEACGRYYFDRDLSPMTTLVSKHHSSTLCPFSGRYTLSGPKNSIRPLLSEDIVRRLDDRDDQHQDALEQYAHHQRYSDDDGDGVEDECSSISLVMHAGCGETATSSELQMEAICHNHLGDPKSTSISLSKGVRTKFRCHGRWSEKSSSNGDRQVIVLSKGANSQTMIKDNSLASEHLCLSYIERDGLLTGYASLSACADTSSTQNYFNMSSSGPCLQALTGNAVSTWNPSWNMVIPSMTCVALWARLCSLV